MFTLILEDKRGGIADEYTFEEGEFYIGRSHTSDIVLPCDNVSRRHARLYTIDGKCYIEDLGSSNGVYVNGRRITEVFQIQRSAQIKVGDYYLHIESDSEPVVEEEKTWCKLIGQNYGFINQIFRITRKVNLLGRGKDCTITVIDPSVSRIHSKLSVDRTGGLSLKDCKSSNGTFINDERIDEAPLAHGDLIRLGNVEFLVEFPGMETGLHTGIRNGKKNKETVSFTANTPPNKEAAKGKAAAKAGKPQQSSSVLMELPSDLNPVVDAKAYHEAIHTKAKPAQERTPSLADQLWPEDSKRRMWVIGGVAGVVVLGVLIWVLMSFVFNSTKSTVAVETNKPEAPIAVGEAQPEQPTQAAPSDLNTLLAKGAEALKGRDWEKARESYAAVLEVDPFNDLARQAINRISTWEADQKRLADARALRRQEKRGNAAKILREISDTSVYFTDAQDELAKLLAERGILETAAEQTFDEKDCETSLLLWRDLLVIAPNDTLAQSKIEEINRHLGTSRCTP